MSSVFKFYEKSSNKHLPGEGSGESLSVQDKDNKKFKELAKIENWRRVLSDFWVNEPITPLEIDDLEWATPEHFY